MAREASIACRVLVPVLSWIKKRPPIRLSLFPNLKIQHVLCPFLSFSKIPKIAERLVQAFIGPRIEIGYSGCASPVDYYEITGAPSAERMSISGSFY
jgi:hypothetical protein